MNILIRTDASSTIGTGHVMRCLTLSDKIRTVIKDARATFACTDYEGNLIDVVRAKNYDVLIAPDLSWKPDTHYDLVIFDHYNIDAKIETLYRPYAQKIMVIDDLADRLHDCDILLDQNAYLNQENRYDGLIPEFCVSLLGPKYALLRNEFLSLRQTVQIRQKLKTILLFISGTDYHDLTARFLDALSGYKSLQIQAVLGRHYKNVEQIQNFYQHHPNIEVTHTTSDMAGLMRDADLAIGAGGSTSWERCALGLPTFILSFADNQIEICKDLDAQGCAYNMGWYDDLNMDTFHAKLEMFMNSPIALQTMSKNAYDLLDGKGTERVVDRIKQIS